jgi:hypothetical protein
MQAFDFSFSDTIQVVVLFQSKNLPNQSSKTKNLPKRNIGPRLAKTIGKDIDLSIHINPWKGVLLHIETG